MFPVCLQAVRYLAECRANREKMKSELGMMLSLQTVIQKQVPVNTTRTRAHTHAHCALSLHKPRICTGIMWQAAHFVGKMAV